MAFKRILLLFVFGLGLVTLVAGQDGIAPSAVGTWLGEAEFAGSKYRLVFHIKVDEDGVLTGTLDSPDRGVKDIPLSEVRLTGEKVLFEISGGAAKYEGQILENATTIEGVWTEGPTILPLILQLTNGPIEARDQPSEALGGGTDLDLLKTTPHFELYSLIQDEPALGDIANALEAQYEQVTVHLNVSFSEKIRVNIYPSVKAFHVDIHLKDGPDWVVAAAGGDRLLMVSPLNPGSVHDYASLLKAIVHEFVHTAVLRLRGEKGLVGFPKWLNEGYAYYEAGQMTKHMRQMAKSKYAKLDLPRWSDLDRASVAEFGTMDGYVLSATIIEFLVKVYGRDKLIKFINNPENIKKIYGETEEELEKSWGRYLRKMG